MGAMQARAAILASILCVWAMAASSPVSRGCSCVESKSTPEQALQNYDAVFLAQTLAITLSTGEEIADGVDVTLKVLETWKGHSAPGDRVVIHTNEDTASCGYPFHVGTTFLVWARNTSGVLTTYLCDRTKATGTGESETDLRHLRDLTETWTWRRVQADGSTLLMPEGFVSDPTPFDLPEDVTRWQAIWWRPLTPARSGGWSDAGRKISYEYLRSADAPPAPLPTLESTVAGKAATMTHVALPDGRSVTSVYWIGSGSTPGVLALHCDVDPTHDVCERVLESIAW